MKKILAAVLLVAAVGFTGCEEETTSPNTPAGANYFPMTQGSSWTYEVTNIFVPGSVDTDTKTIAGDTTVNGKKYFRVNSTDSGTSDFIRRSNDTIFTLSEEGTDEIMAIERKGATWTKTFTDDEASTTVVFTVVDKGIGHTVSGKSYSDVLHVRGEGSLVVEDETIEMEFNGYFAKGVGPVEESTPLGSSKLKSHTIK